MKWLLIVFSGIAGNSFGQDADTTRRSFLDNLFFPFDVGCTFYPANALATAVLFKTTVEYRVSRGNAPFIRLNVSNQFVAYQLPQLGITNATTGRLRFTDYSVGLGYRQGKKKVRGYGLINVGCSAYVFPVVEKAKAISFTVEEIEKATLLSVLVVGVEYYLTPKAAITLELSQSRFWNRTDFWADNPGGIGLSVGVTTTLF